MNAKQRPNLAGMDLNLLVVFEALWLERSVTGAGRRLGLSQPATSGALARLRDMLGDRLFIRGKRGLQPTERCAELAGPLTKTLVDLRNVVSASSFDPATTTRALTIGAVDAAMAVVMPSVLRRTMREAPGAQLHVIGINPERAAALLDDGSIDVALSPRAGVSATVRRVALFPVTFVVAVRPDHPLTKRQGTPADFPRVQVTFGGRPQVSAAVRVSSFLAVPPILASSDAWAYLPSPYARRLTRERAIAVLPTAPNTAPVMKMQLLWPEAQHAAPASQWLRRIIVEEARRLDR